MKKTRIIIGTLFFLFFLIIGIFALSNYGPNWDEPVHFGRGQAILHFFLTGEKDYRSFEKNPPIRRSLYQNNSYEYSYFEKTFRADSNFIIGAGHPVISDLLASVTNRIFYGWLGLLGDVESYHLYSIMLSGILVGVVVYFTSSLYGVFAGIVAGLSLFLYPLFFGESRFNIKDPPETVFYALSAIMFYRGIVSNNWKWIFASSIFAGFAFGTKLNIIFLLVSLFLWLLIYAMGQIRKLSLRIFVKKHKKLIICLVLFPVIPLLLYFVLWPMLWEDPINRFLYNLSYYKRVGLGTTIDPRFIVNGINTYAPYWIFLTTPLPTLILSLSGILWTLRFGLREVHKTSLFVLLWFIVPILRVMFPNTEIYGGVRQIMEFIPAMAILSGIGASEIAKLLNGYIVKRFKRFSNLTIKQFTLVQIGIIVLFIPIALKLISLYPNESIYFNELIGGLEGAAEKNIPGWGNSLGSTYKQGVKWINKYAQKNAKLATIYELRSNIAISDLRGDISFYNQLRTSLSQGGEYIIGVTHQGTGEDRFHRRYLERFLNPVYAVKADGVPVLKVWKNDYEHRKQMYKKEEKMVDNLSVVKDEVKLAIDLKQIVLLTRINIKYNPTNCTLPANGYFELSINGHIWKREHGDFSLSTRAIFSKKGILKYMFAGERTRFIQVIVVDNNSCLLNNPVEIEAYRI